MVADSITDSELFNGSPISRDFIKKRKANWFLKLKQWKIDARRKQWIYQWKDENGSRLKSLTDRKTVSDRFSWRIIDYEEGSYDFDDDDDEIDRRSSASSPTSVLKNKDSNSVDDCFCCSKQVTTEEEEEAFDDAFDNFDGFTDALNFFENDNNKGISLHDLEQKEEDPERKKLFHKDNKTKQPEKAAIYNNSSSNRRRKKKKSDQKQQQKESDDEKSECPMCSEEMDETDLSFLPCPCGFRLCLFCHKKINEDDGRCPACRNKYDDQTSHNTNSGEVSFQQRGRGTVRLSPSFRGLDRA